eukprot:scaffold804_cov165-Amphora_coffeaeformis.AAC.13
MQVLIWHQKTRRQKRKNRFTEQQEQRWEEMLSRLLANSAQHGHCNVKVYDPDDHELAAWTST